MVIKIEIIVDKLIGLLIKSLQLCVILYWCNVISRLLGKLWDRFKII